MRSILALTLMPCLAAPAGAQYLSTLVVPADTTVVVAARGQPQPTLSRTAAQPRSAARRPLRPTGSSQPLISPAGALLATLPLAVAAVLVGTLPGNGGGGTSGPVRTR